MQVDKSKLFYFHNPPPVATDSIYSTPMVPLLCHTRSDSRESLTTYSETIKTNTKQSRKRPSEERTIKLMTMWLGRAPSSATRSFLHKHTFDCSRTQFFLPTDSKATWAESGADGGRQIPLYLLSTVSSSTEKSIHKACRGSLTRRPG